MHTWILVCPNCRTENEIARDAVVVSCGLISCSYTCVNCQSESHYEQPYWQWLGLEEEPPPAATQV